jgi:hypothetical protein
MQKISQPSKLRAFLAALLVLGFFSSCASKETSTEALEPPISEAALLDESDRATPVIDDAAIFSDLNAQPASSELGAGSVASADSSSPFYNPLGGESLGRVAYTLYGDESLFRQLAEQNPELRGVKTLAASQRVFFDFDRVKPVPTFLTKDLLDRYPNELAARLPGAGLSKNSVTLAPGETLQSLSQRLYGTTRYWTEIYLLNKEAISNYDRVPAGVALSVVERPMVGTNEAPPPSAPAVEPVATNIVPAMAPVVEQSQPVAQPVLPVMDTQPKAAAPSPVDPTPEISTQQESTAEPVTRQAVTQPAEKVNAAAAQASLSSSANVRRLVYVGLILLIGALAFFLTRPKKKGFDMLDVTAKDSTAGRLKLTPKDTQHQDIG